MLGTRFVRPLAAYFAYSLNKVIANVDEVIHADSSVYDRVQLMEERDVLIVIAFARYPADVVAVARFAQTLGKRVLAITDSPLSPLLPLADVALLRAPRCSTSSVPGRARGLDQLHRHRPGHPPGRGRAQPLAGG